METRSKWPSTPFIHDRGSSAEIRGTRIGITDVYQMRSVWTREQMAEAYRITVEQVDAANAYIEANLELVEEDMRILRERAARGNSPEVEAKLERNREKLRGMKEKLAREDNARVAG